MQLMTHARTTPDPRSSLSKCSAAAFDSVSRASRSSSAGLHPTRDERPWRLLQLVCAGLIALATSALAQAAIPATERTVLLNLYASTNGPGWGGDDIVGWRDAPPGNDECTLPWTGITCDAGGTHVTEIDLGYRFLSGSLPDLSALTQLQAFHVNDNSLTGSIPALSALTQLQTFDVVGNYLTGPVPALSGMSNLIAFYANENLLSGSIPPLTGLPNLQFLYLNDNHLTGSIPPLGALSALNIIELGGNQLTGPIPALAGLANLSVFEADLNRLSGPIPGLNGLTALYLFKADHNQLSGPIPSLATLTGLINFEVDHNGLSGDPPAPPSQLDLGGSTICPNPLHPPDPSGDIHVWDAATGVTPWYSACDPVFANDFE
jgi:Leucine-rich repeat (LRR) protein